MSSNLPEFHPVFGRLEFDDERNTFSGTIPVRQKKTTVHFEPDSRGNFALAEDRAIRFAHDPTVEFEAVLRYLAGSFVDLANEWADSGDTRVTAQEFRNRLAIESVTFKGNGGVEFAFADGNLFGGHWLVVRLRPDGIIIDAELAG